MSRPNTFERVYAALRERLSEGRLRPGERLEPAALSGEMNASVTPVRDALHRLTGERLVEAPRHEGFRVPLMSETMLRHLYAWHLDILLLAVAKRTLGTPRDHPEDAQIDKPRGVTAAFEALAERTGNPELLAALRSLSARLAAVQRLEALLLGAEDSDTRTILDALSAGNRHALRRALIAYHRRREKIVPQIVARLAEPPQDS